MNLLGEGFPKEINEQVDQRQKIYGSGYVDGGTRTPEEITYLNANTSWVKLVSSTNIIDQDVINNISLRDVEGISDSTLAERFVLFNGTSDNGNALFNGISNRNSILGSTAYGIGGTEFGLRPMMGIKSAHIKHENRGSLRRATVQIKAFNKNQFDIIDVLYLRLGFSVLLEWGHSMYYTNNGVLQKGSDLDNSLASDFLKGGDSYGEFLKKINQKRKTSQGNYDAMFAKVSNIHWSFNVDGSYDITLDLVSIGDVIESFKTNILSPNMVGNDSPLSVSSSGDSFTTSELIEIASFRSNIGQYLKTMSSLIPYESDTVRDFDFSNPIINTTGTVDGIRKNAVKSSNFHQYYCRLGNFLEFLEKYVMYQVTTGDKTLPLMKFDYDVESNLMYVNPLQISVDPRVCVVNKVLIDNNFTYKFLPEGEPFIFSSITTPSKSEYGQIMNIYINFRFILDKLDQLVDVETNSVALIDFLKNIVSGINGALGGMNQLEVFVDEVTNTIKIIDRNPFPNSEKLIEYFARSGSIQSNTYDIDDKYAKFYLYGYNPDNKQSGFIKDFRFKTELSPAMSTMITVAAAANSSVVGENATALSRLNNGLKDRYKDLISNTNDGSTKKIDLAIKYEDIFVQMQNQFEGVYVPFIKYLVRLEKFTYSDDEIDTYKDSITNLIKYEQLYHDAYVNWKLAEKRIDPKTIKSRLQPGTGFIPFNLSLTMDGLSGMKINSKFLIDASYLPSNYPETVEFLIKNLEHRIENNKWFTTLDSYCISKGEYTETEAKNINPQGQSQPSSPSPSPSNTISGRYSTFTDNNPFNLRPNGGTQFNGYTGKKEGFRGNTSIGYFAVFDTKTNGIRAGLKNLEGYFTRRKLKTIKSIINTYAPGGSTGQSQSNTNSYVNFVVNYMKKNWDASVTDTTILSFSGASETNPNNIKMFKELNLAILKQEGKLTTDLIASINSFDIKNLA